VGTARVFLFDRWFEIDATGRRVRIVPLRVPSVVTGITMLAIPAALLVAVRSGEYVLTTTGDLFVAVYTLLAVAFVVMPFAPSNRLTELDLGRNAIRRLGVETPLAEAGLRFVGGDRRGSAHANLGGKDVRFLYLANGFEGLARLVVHAAAAGIRGEPDALLAQLRAEALLHERRAYVVHAALPVVMIGAGLAYYWLYVTRRL
jgi:hypothetical protein